MTRRLGSARISLADRAVTAVARLARITTAVAHAVAALPSWRLTDLYAALWAYRFAAAHDLIDQAAELGDDDTRVVAARTWPWFGADYVYETEENH
ncbi:hypothetical protein [Streptomyces mangrovi]|uniref:hypothetical protein n=1 Tax=Streptomyces mangrovi TaxID=1206892 RepID=UPI00399CA87E